MDWELADGIWILVSLGIIAVAAAFVHGIGEDVVERWRRGSTESRIDDLEQRLEAAFDALERRVAACEKGPKLKRVKR